jgi:hypothetical protein
MQNINDKNKPVESVCKLFIKNLEYFDNEAIKILGFYCWFWKLIAFMFPISLTALLNPH